MKVCTGVGLGDVIMNVNLKIEKCWWFWCNWGENSLFPIDFARGPYHRAACESPLASAIFTMVPKRNDGNKHFFSTTKFSEVTKRAWRRHKNSEIPKIYINRKSEGNLEWITIICSAVALHCGKARVQSQWERANFHPNDIKIPNILGATRSIEPISYGNVSGWVAVCHSRYCIKTTKPIL